VVVPVKPAAGVNVTDPSRFTVAVPFADGATIVTDPGSSELPLPASLASTGVVTGVFCGVRAASGLAVSVEAAASAISKSMFASMGHSLAT
jgi:hypothetical protein